jgi:hypothetical protein
VEIKIQASPVMLSAIVPGLGQYVQRRWVAGTLYLVATLGPGVAVVWLVVRALMQNLNAALAFAEAEANQPFGSLNIPMLIWLTLLCLLSYAACMVDAHLATLRRAKRASDKRQGARGE